MQVDEFLTRSAERFPDKTAVMCGGQRVTFAELNTASDSFASSLAERGITNGDRIGVLLENGIDAACAIMGILKAGAAFSVISQTIKEDKLRFILEDCGARALVTQPIFSRMVESVQRAIPTLEFVVSCGPGLTDDDRTVCFADQPSPGRRTSSIRPPIDLDVAALIYTSGSTGFPKGVTVSHRNVVSAATSITQYLENRADDVIINVLPFSFDYGLYQLLMSLKVGATLVLEKSFAYPYKVVETVREQGVTGFPGVPTVFAMLLQMKNLDPGLFDSVRYVTNTAAALPPSHISKLQSMFRNARIFAMYGLTECKRVAYLPPEELTRRPTSVGKAMPNVEVYIVDEDGNQVPPGETGELVVRGSNVMLGYWNRPQETAKALRAGKQPWDRVLYTGDLFTADEDGFLYFVARKDDIIKSRGEKVSPAEVERIIYELDAVQEVAVVGIPDPILGRALKAVVVLVEPGAVSERDIVHHCGSRLESFMVPKEVEFRASLPKTSSGKISRQAIQNECCGNQSNGD